MSLSHLDETGAAHMVDVGGKDATRREATASATVVMSAPTLALVVEGQLKKGDVFGAARLAGILAAKQTPHLIPLCHPLPLDSVEIEFKVSDAAPEIEIIATAATTAKTGVEMEAITAVTIAAVTVYDMCKSAEKGIIIKDIHLISKSGGKSGSWHK
jgi:cyclic pyranopterin monophosphate synthase